MKDSIQSNSASSAEAGGVNGMVERVARAIWNSHGDSFNDGLQMEDDPMYRDMARAAIEAMEKPTQEMLDAALLEKERVAEQFPATDTEGSGAPSGADYWRVMHAAAIGGR